MRKNQKLQGLSRDALAKYMWKGNEQFADLFNAVVYKGPQISPDSLSDTDTDLSALIADKELLETIKKVRDVVKISTYGTRYQVLAIENQQAVHYAMAFRCMLYDALSYYHQFKKISAKNKDDKSLKGDEYLSLFKKTDRFSNCRTIVIYNGEKKWDAARSFSELVNFASEDDRKAFNDYSYELICVNEMNVSEYQFHDKNTRDFFLYVSTAYQNGATQLPDELRDMDIEVAYIAAALTGTLDLVDSEIKKRMNEGKESVNMCEAVNRALLEREEKGVEIGREQGIEIGIEKVVTEMILDDQPTDKIIKYTKVSEDFVEALREKLCAKV